MRKRSCYMQGYSDASAIQTLKAETLRNRSISNAYVAILSRPTKLRLIRAYLGCGYGRPRQQLRAYYCYRYGLSTATGAGVLRLWLRAYYNYGYGRTTATGVLQLRLRAYYNCSYGRTYGRTTLTFLLHILYVEWLHHAKEAWMHQGFKYKPRKLCLNIHTHIYIIENLAIALESALSVWMLCTG